MTRAPLTYGMTRDEIIQATIEYGGITRNPNYAGFILPDGRMVKVDAAHIEAAEEIMQSPPGHQIEALEALLTLGGLVRLRTTFMAGTVMAQVYVMPTEAQVQRLIRIYREGGGNRIFIDVGGGTVAGRNVEFTFGATAAQVYAALTAVFDG